MPLQSAIVQGSHLFANGSQLGGSQLAGNGSNLMMMEQAFASKLVKSHNVYDAALLSKSDRLNSRKIGLIDTLSRTDLRILTLA